MSTDKAIIGSEKVQSSRNQTIDIIKGIGIILVVWGHINIESIIEQFIGMFHMAIFFTASGYCWNKKHIKSFSAMKNNCVSKIRTLYFPFVFINIFFVLMNNVLIRIGMMSETAWLSGREILIHSVKAFFLLRCPGIISGPTWFLRTLFFVQLGHIILSYILYRVPHGRYVNWVVIFLCVGLSEYICVKGGSAQIQTMLSGYLAYNLGIAFKVLQSKGYFNSKRKSVITVSGLFSFFGLCVLTRFGEISFWNGQIKNTLFFVLASCMGWLMMWCVSSLCLQIEKVGNALSRIGKHTLVILLFHVLCFQPVTFLTVMLANLDRSILYEIYPVTVMYTLPLVGFVYFAAGVFGPLLIEYLYNRLKQTAGHLARS